MVSPSALLTRARQRRPFLDHLVRAVQRYQADTGDRLAAAVTYYWFLSLFPIVLLAVSLLGYVYGDDASAKVQDALGGVLPPALVETLGTTLEEAKGPAGVLGILGTLYSGLGWIDALREAIRSIWHQNVTAGNIVVRKLLDVVVLVGLFATIGASVVTTGLVTGFTADALDLLHVDDSTPARVFTRLLGYALALVADTALFLYLFGRLSRVANPFRRLIRGALLGAVGFEVLKVLGGIYVARTTSKGEATYGTFAVVVGLLLFLNLFTRFLLLTSAFVVTAPYDSDVAPSGTASTEQARKAGIPEEFADHDPDDPPTLSESGAPAPLVAAVQGRTAPQDEPEGRETDGRRASALVAAGPGRLPGEAAVTTAARLLAAAGGVVLASVGLHALGTVRRLLRRRRA
ncbi:MAG: putative integral rane protein [Frankiales bacterium]|nr:putative integral rane protein [Frankiales bacterium]